MIGTSFELGVLGVSWFILSRPERVDALLYEPLDPGVGISDGVSCFALRTGHGIWDSAISFSIARSQSEPSA